MALRGVLEPAGSGEVSGRILYEALRGLRYVIANRTLRWIAISMSILNVGWGMVIVALPVIVFRLHGSAAVVGVLLALNGAIGIPAALFAGRVRTEGRERQFMAILGAIMGLATLHAPHPVDRGDCRRGSRSSAPPTGRSTSARSRSASAAPHGPGSGARSPSR